MTLVEKHHMLIELKQELEELALTCDEKISYKVADILFVAVDKIDEFISDIGYSPEDDEEDGDGELYF